MLLALPSCNFVRQEEERVILARNDPATGLDISIKDHCSTYLKQQDRDLWPVWQISIRSGTVFA